MTEPIIKMMIDKNFFYYIIGYHWITMLIHSISIDGHYLRINIYQFINLVFTLYIRLDAHLTWFIFSKTYFFTSSSDKAFSDVNAHLL